MPSERTCSAAPSTECPNRPEWAMPGVPAISPEGFCFHCSKVRGEWVKCEADSACGHEHVSRVQPLYVDGRPLYKCDDCGARFVYEDDEPSFKALVPLKEADRGE